MERIEPSLTFAQDQPNKITKVEQALMDKGRDMPHAEMFDLARSKQPLAMMCIVLHAENHNNVCFRNT